MHSAIYHGWLRHRRYTPRRHDFRYPLFLMYLDLAELDEVFRGRWLWSTQRRTLARFDRADHLGDMNVPLDQAVRDLVQQQTGRRPRGPIRLLTHLRYLGHCFNPVSFYYCFDTAGANVECMVAEVNNTPWGEQHCYVLSEPRYGVAGKFQRYISDKAFHVSPFMPMHLAYEWGFSVPGARLNVHMALRDSQPAGNPAAAKVFDATLRLEHAPVTAARLALALVRFPVMTLQVVAAIHWQALKLWLKRVPVHTHPAKLKNVQSDTLIKPL
jgi:uncharacterized protein